MSKGLETLKEIAIQSVEAIIGKQEPLRTQKINELLNTKQFETIEKELKALEIIKEKEINIHALLLHLKRFDSPDGYNTLVGDKYKITQEEWNLLKEVLL